MQDSDLSLSDKQVICPQMQVICRLQVICLQLQAICLLFTSDLSTLSIYSLRATDPKYPNNAYLYNQLKSRLKITALTNGK